MSKLSTRILRVYYKTDRARCGRRGKNSIYSPFFENAVNSVLHHVKNTPKI